MTQIPQTTDKEEIKPARRITNWIFRIACLIIFSFVLLSAIGAFIPAKYTAEASIDIDAPVDIIFPYLSDLEYFQDWSPWHSEESADTIIGGADSDTGQIAAWTCRTEHCLPGTQEIVIVRQGEYVQTILNLNGEPAEATYALMQNENSDLTTVLMQVDQRAGGFPFTSRVFKRLRKSAMEKRYERALAVLKTEAEAQLD